MGKKGRTASPREVSRWPSGGTADRVVGEIVTAGGEEVAVATGDEECR